MKKKISLMVFLIILIMLFNITAFADKWNEGEVEHSESKRVLKIWSEEFPYETIINGEDVYLFEASSPDKDQVIKRLDLGDDFGGTRTFMNGPTKLTPTH